MATNNATGFPILDEDDMVSDSAGSLATQQSIKAYVDYSIGVDSAVTLIATATPSGVASVDFTDLTTDYYAFLFVIDRLIPATDGASAWIRTSQDNGSTFNSGSTDYTFESFSVSSAATSSITAATTSRITLKYDVGNGASSQGLWGRCLLINPDNPSNYPSFINHISGINSSALRDITMQGAFRFGAVTVNAVRFLFSSGNISSGTIKLYGYKAS